MLSIIGLPVQAAGVERCSEAAVVTNLGIWRKLLGQSSEGAITTIILVYRGGQICFTEATLTFTSAMKPL